MRQLPYLSAATLLLAALLAACTQKNTADDQAATDAASASADAASGINRLLLFPNPVGTDPLARDGGTFETNTTEYAAAYYRAIDPNNVKDTIDKWRAQNGFTGYANPARPGTEHLAVFRDVKDLGYGRRMTGRFNSDDNGVAFYVENYNVTPNGSAGYSSELNVDAAIRRDTQWHVGTNAIEWSVTACIPNFDPPDCDGTVKFAKYFNFSSKDGTRQFAVDLDGRGLKAMPGPCITCHGGRGDPLTPPDAGNKPRFPLVENSLSRKRGDVQGRLHGQNVDSFSYSTTQPGFAKSDLQPILKDFNQWILCTYPSPTLTPGLTVNGGWGTCTRQTAGANEWQGTAGPMIEYWYGGPGMNANFSERCDLSGQPCYVPAGWTGDNAIPNAPFTDTALYKGVVAPYCRTCHILRGTANQNDIDFAQLGVPAAVPTPATGFRSYVDRIKALVFDRGNMPNALIPHRDFWNSSTAPQMLATFIDAEVAPGTATSGGAPLMPERLIADPGPDRVVRTGSNAVLTAENSLFASTFSWTFVSGPSTPTISGANEMVAIFNATVASPTPYVVRLTVGNGASTATKDVAITVDDTFPDFYGLRFAHIRNVFQNLSPTPCVTCHKVPANPTLNKIPPIFYADSTGTGSLDRDLSGAVDSTDEAWFIKELMGRVNFTELQASPLLRKPTGNHHNGGTLLDLSTPEGRRNYSIFYNWILAGMPPGGVAANAVVNGGVPVPALTFGGAFPGPYMASIPLDGSTSIGATSYFWSILSGPSGPGGGIAAFSNPTSPTPTLSVPNVGTYVVQLQASDGTLTDTNQRSIVVSETPITADFSPPTGTTVVTFSGNPGRGNIVLTSMSSGSPVTCRWQVFELVGTLVGTLLDNSPALDVTKPCGTPATLNVPASVINNQLTIQLTALNIALSGPAQVASHTVTIGNGTPVVASIVTNNGTDPAARQFAGGNPATGAASTATVPLNGNGSSGIQPLTFSWSITSEPDSTNGPASLSSTTAAAPTLTVRATGSYTVRLQVTDAANNTAATTSTFSVTPTNGVTFAAMTANFVSFGCTGCHQFFAGFNNNPDPATNNTGTTTNLFRPSWENVNDVNQKTLWRRVFQRTVPNNTARSLIILNPTDANNVNNDNPIGTGYTTPHGGGCQLNFGCGLGDSSRLTIFQNWVNDGGPPGN